MNALAPQWITGLASLAAGVLMTSSALGKSRIEWRKRKRRHRWTRRNRWHRS